MRNFYFGKDKLDALEAALGKVGRSEAGELVVAIEAFFQDLEGDAINAKQAASYPEFDPNLHDVATESTLIVAEKIWNMREYLQTKAAEYKPQEPLK